MWKIFPLNFSLMAIRTWEGSKAPIRHSILRQGRMKWAQLPPVWRLLGYIKHSRFGNCLLYRAAARRDEGQLGGGAAGSDASSSRCRGSGSRFLALSWSPAPADPWHWCDPWYWYDPWHQADPQHWCAPQYHTAPGMAPNAHAIALGLPLVTAQLGCLWAHEQHGHL